MNNLLIAQLLTLICNVKSSLTYVLSWLPAVDITVYHNGFHGDLNETFFVGDVDEEAKKLVQTTYECLMQAIDSGTGLARSHSLATPFCR